MARKKSAAKKAREAAAQAPSGANDIPITKDRPEIQARAPVVSDSEGSYSDSESDEDEDEFGELVTEDVEAGINNVLKAIRENPTALLNKDIKFFDSSATTTNDKKKEDKPIYLKDYHRMNILAGGDNADEDENEDGEKPFAIQQKEDRERLVSEIHGALGGDDDEDDDEDDFLVKRKEEREVKPIDLPDPNQNENEFLQAFLDTKGWLPQTVDKKTGKTIVPSYGDIIEDDDEFDDRAEQYEIKHNFRFEDDNAGEIVSYARNQTTLRRTQESTRKKQREAKIQARLEEEKKKEAKVARIKNKKVKEVASKFEQLKQALGGDGDDAADEDTLQRLLAASENLDILDFEGDEWDKKMEQVFNDDFYSKGGHKPKLGDDDNDNEDDDQDEDDAEGAADLEETAGNDDEEESPKLSKNQQKREEKRKKKLEQQQIRNKAQEIVEKNLDTILEKEGVTDDKADDDTPKFRYRAVSPDSFGLSSRDILLANDNQLNEYVGLKKLASFRDPEKKKKDHRKYAKKRRLREWRKSNFDNEEEPSDEAIIAALQGTGEPTAKKQKKSHKKHKK
ncbi:hypothetical protein D0Z00_003289 [Geotrichum galactomycetum]|uniref:Uncharacterized protein n=1 Tax=Geotrichum galactomycetum TaxID=27317 RepID=A0ACB6V1S4_9ASCO|nr:hypothetical protein D0Z00_003289 [Geotrichum candidum]